MISAFLHGYLLAFGLILPLGPQNAFILSQGAERKRWFDALPAVLAACLADTLLIVLAVVGVSAVVLTLPWFRTVLVLCGVGFLAYIGWLNWRAQPGGEGPAAPAHPGARQQVAFALAVSLLNPHAILDTIGVIGTSALAYAGDAKTWFALGCILNSWAWFTALSLLGRSFGRDTRWQVWLTRGSALVMWLSAVYLIGSLFGI